MKTTSFAKELLHFALIVIFVVLPIRLFVAQPFVVVGSSMEPTFLNNDYLIVDEISYRLRDPKRGDVIVFKYHSGLEEQTGEPQEGGESKYFIKRIIGLPGETVDIRNGKVTITNSANPEGIVLNETYIKNLPSDTMTVTLEKDRYFVMGDNRSVSFDSRRWGPLGKDEIVGKALVRLLPLNKADFLPGSNAVYYKNETQNETK
jgi:signal peptidase I